MIIILDSTVQIAAIKCLIEVVIYEPNTEEQIMLMRYQNLYKNSLGTNSWIVLYCVDSIKVRNNRNKI